MKILVVSCKMLKKYPPRRPLNHIKINLTRQLCNGAMFFTGCMKLLYIGA